MEIQELTNELEAANEKIDDVRDKDLIRKQKRECEELKQKFLQKDQECDELRRERDRCREEKNECLIKFSKQIDAERNEKRIYKTESEKLSIRVRFLDEESKKNKIKSDSISNDNEIQKRERDTFLEEIRKKDDLIHQLQRRITELEDDHVIQEGRALEKEQKIYNEERDKFLEERNRVISLQREFDQLKQNFTDINEENKQLRVKIQKDITLLRQELAQASEERDKLKRVTANQEKEIQDCEKQARLRDEQLNELERELENVRRRYRESQQRIQNLENNVDTLQRYKSTFQVQNQVQNISPTTAPTSDNNNNSSASKKELENERKKTQKLKEKLKLANDKIMDLLQFKVRSQAQTEKLMKNQTLNQGVVGGGYGANELDDRLNDYSIPYSQQQQQQVQGTSSLNIPHIQQQYNYAYMSNPQHLQKNNQFGGVTGLNYEDEKVLQEINRRNEGHKYSSYA